jgi:hypothetical protein
MTAWELMEYEQLQASRAAYEQRPDYHGLVAEAARRGYRRIRLSEQLEPGKVDAYSWRGGVWVKAST